MVKEFDEVDGFRRYFKRFIINLYIFYIKILYDLEENFYFYLFFIDVVIVIII